MNTEETEKIQVIVKEAINGERSKKEAFETFVNAGIITKKGKLKSPYKEIFS